jgi:metallo-beta-lactamase class B
MLRCIATVVLMVVGSLAQEGNRPHPPYKIAGNLFYVGADDITSYLITTPQGHILVNTGYETTPALIRASVEQLGFKVSDIKIMLNGQAHIDHVAGQAVMKEMSGAEVWASAADAPVIEGGGKGDFRFDGIHSYPPVKVSRIVKDGDRVTLGGTTLVAHLTPGHTKGCTTWTMQVTEGGRTYDAVIVGGTGINPGVTVAVNAKYPKIAEDYARTFRVLRALKCDIFLGAHGNYYGMRAKYERMKAGAGVAAFVDPDGYAAFVNHAEKAFLDQLAREKKALH